MYRRRDGAAQAVTGHRAMYILRSIAIKDKFRVNNRIRSREVRLITAEGEQVGVVSIDDALRRAEDQGLDLVEVAPNATPPVCRLMDYGKFRYEQSKKEREARRHQKQVEVKELRMKPRTDDHDIETKARQARKFLQAGDKVKFTVRFRGREMAHTDIGQEMLDQLVEQLRDIAVVEQKAQMESRAMSVVMAPDARTLKAAQKAQRERLKASKPERGTKERGNGAAKDSDGAATVATAADEDDDTDDVTADEDE